MSQLERERILNQQNINSTLNSSQLHDYGYSERKRYEKLNNTSDIFNVKGEENNIAAATNANKRRYQHHHYQLTSPFGRDDIAVDNPHKVQSVYNLSQDPREQQQQQQQQPPRPSSQSYEYQNDRVSRRAQNGSSMPLDMESSMGMNLPSTEGNIPQTEAGYGPNSEMSTMEGYSNRMPTNREGNNRNGRRIPPTSTSSNGIEKQEDIFVSREELQTPEQRKEALLKRQKLDQLLNNDQPMMNPGAKPSSQPQPQSFAPYATTFDLKKSNENGQGTMLSSAPSSISVSGLAPFATVDFNPYERYASGHREAPSSAQVQEYNQQLNHNLNQKFNYNPMMMNPPYEHSHEHVHDHDHSHSHDINYQQQMEQQQQQQQQQQPITPYFHETSSRHLPREEDIMSNYDSTTGWKGKEKIDEDRQALPPEQHMKDMPSTSDPTYIPATPSKPSMVDIDKESGAPLSKDHITSSFDKATALSDRNYFNKIMNDHSRPVETPEEIINKEKYEQAKNRFDELYRDLINTEDLKNHPELLEELNRISGTSNPNPNPEMDASPHDRDTMSMINPSPAIASPPPPSQMSYGPNASYAPKEDIYHSLEDLDKKLEKISFDSNQATTSTNMNKDQPNEMNSTNNMGSDNATTTNNNNNPETSAPSVVAPSVVDPMEYNHHSRLNRRNYNESHIFDGPEVTPVRQELKSSNSSNDKSRLRTNNSFNNIFGTNETDPEGEKQAQDNRRIYSRRHLKLAQQNHSDIFCLGGDSTTQEQKLLASDVGMTELPPEVPSVTISRRSSQMNLKTSDDNPMITTYGSMSNSVSSIDRRQLANQPTYGISSEQSHRTYKSKSRRYTPARSSQILF